MVQIIIKTETEDTTKVQGHMLSDVEYDTVVKGLRMILLVGNDRDTMAAANLLDLLLPMP